MARQVHQAIPAGKEESVNEQSEEAPRGWARWGWIILAVVSGVYIVFPEWTDLIPVVGWIDEGIAAIFLTTALSRLGIHIPILDTFLRRKQRKSKNKSSVKDVSRQ